MADLISRAAAIEHMKSMAGCATCNNYNGVRCRACIWDDAMNIVDEAHAVDAVPVVQGEWVEEPDRRGHYHCSNCGVVWGVSAKAMKYCPNCAAKMMNSPMWEVDGERRESE